MKFPNFLMNKSFSARALVILAGLFLMALTVPAQKVPEANPSADLDQCRNGSTGTDPCAGANWVNGNVGTQNSQYSEDQYLPYRMVFTNLTSNATYTVVIGYDTIHSGKHAIDYLGTYNTKQITTRATDTAALRSDTDPCTDILGATTCAMAPSTIAITKDPLVTAQTNPYTLQPIYEPNNQVFTMWGGNLLSFAYVGNVVSNDVERQVRLTFTAAGDTVVLAWSGHVAYGGDWGAGNSAGGISGSPYHMRLKGFCPGTIAGNGCTTGGNQDRSLSADAVIISGIINIVKAVSTQDGSGAAFTAFPFTASTGFGFSSFSLVDDNAGPGIDTQQSVSIQSFGAANAITVTEENTFGWTLESINCTTNVASSVTQNIPTQPAPNAGSVTITTNAGGFTTCTFNNTQLGITAAPATVTGRVFTASGLPVRGVTVEITNISTGDIRTATTNSFGYYTFTDLTTEDLYRLTPVSNKRYQFDNSVRMFTLMEDLAGLDFFANN
jgi:hypothetical protein